MQVRSGMQKLPPILVVDDETDDVFILKRLLGKVGVQNSLVTFEDSLAAIDYLEIESTKPGTSYIPWIVFTDLHMPAVNGVELTRRIRANAALAGVTIIMVTSSQNPADHAAARDAGADEYIAKYPTVAALKQLVQRYLPKMKVFPA